jgi:signal transduction histidine kinase
MSQRIPLRHAPAAAAVLLGALAAAQAAWAAAPAASGILAGHWLLLLVIMVALGLATTLPAGLLGRQPAVAGVAVSAASVLSLAAFHTLTVAGLIAELAVLYRVGRSGRQLVSAGLALPFLVLALVSPGQAGTRILTVLLASLGPLAAWSGCARWARSEARQYHAARQDLAGRLQEHTARGERARISRELHDVVAHHISMIAVQAETARLATPGMPAAGAQRLAAIGDTARAALTEMRRLLGVLREDTGPGPAQLQPQPGLQQLNELLDEARATSGAGTRLIVCGPMGPLDPGVELAAYRIVQEALTNTRRHAAGAAVDVELRYRDDGLLLRIRDNGPGPPPAAAPGGLGLVGMRERAAAVGGELRAGPSASGGFLITATLPSRAERPASDRCAPADRPGATAGTGPGRPG